MVFFFKSCDKRFIYYMGRDKHENELLIKYGWQKDVWFHVDDLSSAHVYLRLPKGVTIDDVPENVLEECAQLVKANSIQGNKLKNVKIVYTMWENLHKRKSMEIGQIGFHDTKKLKYTKVEERKNAIVNRINKTRIEKESETIKETWDEMMRKKRRKAKAKKKKEEAERKKQMELAKKKAEEQEFKALNDGIEEEGTLNTDVNMTAEEFEDDFM
eukprot:CAMPEP_0170171212 /NCGR_PEP_ID=MMETSP0040_2-20121228/4332_1 /TAXON_ID=641309 /ORGANISM="Lotharella oceanica, Strain CCMP622" /LENGTH=213 /DNA_ID=CAMNT_0010411125 /DNA_START=5 /DNA_END=646 /DNA_ORIENTATION=+